MKRNKVFSSSIAFILLMSIVLAGCQSVGGVDINKALLSQYELTTYESDAEYSIEFIVDEEVEQTKEEKDLLKYLQNATITMDEIKSEDLYTQSMKGALQLPFIDKIPFEMMVSQQDVTILVEGLNKPININSYMDQDMPEDLDINLEEFEQAGIDLVKLISKFIIENTPNPSTIEVESVEEKVNGKKMELNQIHVKIDGSELIPLFVEAVQNMFEDEEELKQFISDLYDIYVPLIIASMPEEVLEDPSSQMILSYLENKDLSVEYAFTFLMTNVKPYIADLEVMLEEFINDPVMNEIFSENNYLVTDIYVDEDLNIRKQTMELVIQPDMEDMGAIQGFKLYGESDVWNIDGNVKAATIDTTEVIDLTDVDNVSPAIFFKEMDRESTLYELLDHFELTTNRFYVYPHEDIEYVSYYDFPIMVDGVTYASEGYLLSELDVTTEWVAENQISIVDIMTEKEILITLDSNEAIVDGETVQMSNTPVVIEGEAHFPLRFVVKNLDALIYFDEEMKRIVITKEY
ncbi:copper amine oxidase N-terminal domain-containing protein [Chengkuizengella axinellae]|uniref:Copper amine oxidase N-terminal domain-containing protein n=1 Tax=Chengkuizengella axinellae TaxID=3064388 RepID=A0ABT9IYA1_9BACL|nr:copper amine oxidase N-terminal domain-containing protein [Chengkuizengella sp. 2205SS18-9]MDP5274326.1 copper amine oxidase N-terminal domain-containing protein [Chengkuizengella sp. 2205SS18-9]